MLRRLEGRLPSISLLAAKPIVDFYLRELSAR